MRRRHSTFGPWLRLLAVFGIGAAGVTVAVPRAPSPAPEPDRTPTIQFAHAVIKAAAPIGVDPAAAETADVIPWPWLDEMSQVELSQALLADLSRNDAIAPQQSRGPRFVSAVPPPTDRSGSALAYNQTVTPVAVTARFDGVLADDAASTTAGPSPSLASPASSGY